MIKLEDDPRNFRGKNGKPFVVYCPACHKENWAMAVASGECAWCGWYDKKESDDDN